MTGHLPGPIPWRGQKLLVDAAHHLPVEGTFPSTREVISGSRQGDQGALGHDREPGMIRIDHRFPSVAAQRPKARDKNRSRRSAARSWRATPCPPPNGRRRRKSFAGEHLGQALPGLPFPLRHPVGVQVMLGSELGQGQVADQGLQGDFGLELGGKATSFPPVSSPSVEGLDPPNVTVRIPGSTSLREGERIALARYSTPWIRKSGQCTVLKVEAR